MMHAQRCITSQVVMIISPYIGILIKDDRKYVIPLSSVKEKHKKWKISIKNAIWFMRWQRSTVWGKEIFGWQQKKMM